MSEKPEVIKDKRYTVSLYDAIYLNKRLRER